MAFAPLLFGTLLSFDCGWHELAHPFLVFDRANEFPASYSMVASSSHRWMASPIILHHSASPVMSSALVVTVIVHPSQAVSIGPGSGSTNQTPSIQLSLASDC